MKKNILLLLAISILVSCTDPYTLKTNNYEEALVIEATITNELKHQEIKLSKTYRLEETVPTTVTNAVVYVTDNLGNSYEFQEQNDRYVSVNEFQAQPNVQYKLKIITDDGKSYTSTNETLTQVNPIQSVVPTVVNKNGEQGVEMIVNSYDPTNSSKYYRYEYEETYKIIAPKWNALKGVLVPGTFNDSVLMVPRTTEAKTCYSSNKNNDIILHSTNNLQEDRVIFPVRYISTKNYIISHRYSILVKQYVQNLAAFTYYNALKQVSGNGSLLSQNQPGFFSGNIKSMENPNEKVIGFFDVSSVSSQRIFFNYSDLFPGQPLPPYYIPCPEIELKYCFNTLDPDCKGWDVNGLISINSDLIYYIADPIYVMVKTPCGDCTSFSSNIIPSFWID